MTFKLHYVQVWLSLFTIHKHIIFFFADLNDLISFLFFLQRLSAFPYISPSLALNLFNSCSTLIFAHLVFKTCILWVSLLCVLHFIEVNCIVRFHYVYYLFSSASSIILFIISKFLFFNCKEKRMGKQCNKSVSCRKEMRKLSILNCVCTCEMEKNNCERVPLSYESTKTIYSTF